MGVITYEKLSDIGPTLACLGKIRTKTVLSIKTPIALTQMIHTTYGRAFHQAIIDALPHHGLGRHIPGSAMVRYPAG